MTATTALPVIRTGDRVRGVYCRVPFTGTVTLARSHTIRWDVEVFHIALDAPIEVYGRVENEAVSMHMTRTGDPADGFSHAPDVLRVVPTALDADTDWSRVTWETPRGQIARVVPTGDPALTHVKRTVGHTHIDTDVHHARPVDAAAYLDTFCTRHQQETQS